MTEVKLINKSAKPQYLTFNDLKPGEYFVEVNSRNTLLRKSQFNIIVHAGDGYNSVFVESDNFRKVDLTSQVERVKKITIEYEME